MKCSFCKKKIDKDELGFLFKSYSPNHKWISCYRKSCLIQASKKSGINNDEINNLCACDKNKLHSNEIKHPHNIYGEKVMI